MLWLRAEEEISGDELSQITESLRHQAEILRHQAEMFKLGPSGRRG